MDHLLARGLYIQLKDFLMNSKYKMSYCLPLLPIENICYNRSPITNTTSLAYCCLNQTQHKDDSQHKKRWKKDLNIKITAKQWENACIMTHKSSLSTKYQETSYKMVRHAPQGQEVVPHNFGHMLALWGRCGQLLPFMVGMPCTSSLLGSSYKVD